MENELLRVPSVLYDLQKFASIESAISSLTSLNEIISSSQEEMELLYRSEGITVIMSFLNSDSELAKICLKILAYSSKRHEKVRKLLLEKNIFRLLAVKLKKETDFSSNILILYCALIVVLVRGDFEAQNQMRTSECLSSLIYLLTHALSESDHKPLSCRNTELFIYAIIASYRDPKHTANQTEAGCVTPKILEYLEKQTVYSDSDQLQLAKYFWFFLRTILDKNEMNQQIFIESFGLSILFRSIQSVEETEKEEMEDLLIKLTGVLVKLKSHKEFLSEASNYCPVMILSSLLKTSNCLVRQQIIIFLESLTREFPQSLQLMQSTDMLKQIKQIELILTHGKTVKLCRDLLNRVANFCGNQIYTKNSSFSQYSAFAEENTDFEEISESSFLENHFCVVHGSMSDFQDYPGDLLEAVERNRGDFSVRKIVPFYRKGTREKERKLRRILTRFFPNEKINRFNVWGIGRKIIQTFKTFLSFLSETQFVLMTRRKPN